MIKKLAMIGDWQNEIHTVIGKLRELGYTVYGSEDQVFDSDKAVSVTVKNEPPINEDDRDGFDGVFVMTGTGDEVVDGWIGTPHLRVVDSENAVFEVMRCLGEPEPIEIERKYLISRPDVSFMECLELCRGVDIVQTYLTFPDGSRTRIRKRGGQYFRTTKKSITAVKRIEIEDRLSAEEYEALLHNRDIKRRRLAKTRYCYLYDGQYFEIDLFPFWDDVAFAELELSDENDEIRFPQWMQVIRDVTEDKEYTNSALAQEID